MLCHDWRAVAPAIAAVRKAYREGRLDAAEGSKSLERINRVCDLAEISEPQPPLATLGCEEHRRLNRQIRERLA